MTLDEMHALQAKTEATIVDAISRFMDATGCKVEDLSYYVHNMDEFGESRRYIPVVILRVVL